MCFCGDSECRSCGILQGTREEKIMSESQIVCRHGEIGDDGICKQCGARAAISLGESSPEKIDRAFSDGVRSLKILILEEIGKPDHAMPHTHKPDIQLEHQWEYCWRCKIERVLDSAITGYKVNCRGGFQE
jgi:hypothetical protein